jgi:hypothetical protein
LSRCFVCFVKFNSAESASLSLLCESAVRLCDSEAKWSILYPVRGTL